MEAYFNMVDFNNYYNNEDKFESEMVEMIRTYWMEQAKKYSKSQWQIQICRAIKFQHKRLEGGQWNLL